MATIDWKTETPNLNFKLQGPTFPYGQPTKPEATPATKVQTANTKVNFSDYNQNYGTDFQNNELNTYDYNEDKSARWNRKQMKKQLMSAGMDRRDAKAMATDLTGRLVTSGVGNNDDKRWVNKRLDQYHSNGSGGIERNSNNFKNIMGTVGMGLIGGPAGAAMFAGTRDWKTNSGSWTPGQLREKPVTQPSTTPTFGTQSSWNTPVALKPLTTEKPNFTNTPQNQGQVLREVTVTPEWKDTRWGKAATKMGFETEDQVKAWQRMAGLVADGKFGENSQQRWKALSDAGYRKELNSDGSYALYDVNKNKITPDDLQWEGNELKAAQAPTTPQTTEFNYGKFAANTGYDLRKATKISDIVRTSPSGHMQISDPDLRRAYGAQYKTKLGGRYNLAEDFYKEGKDDTFERNYKAWLEKQNYLKKATGVFGPAVYSWSNKMQQGGSLSKEDQQEKMLTYATLGVIGYANANKKAIDFTTAVGQVMQLAKENPETLQEIAGNKELIQSGVEILKRQEPKVLEMISKPGGMKKVIEQLSQKAPMAKQGTKLNYIKHLKGICPEGYEVVYMAKGGAAGCPVCKKAAKGTEVSEKVEKEKPVTGGVSSTMNNIKADLMKCGGKKKVVKNQNPAKPITKKTQKLDHNGVDPNSIVGRDKEYQNLVKKGDQAGQDSLLINKYNDQETMMRVPEEAKSKQGTTGKWTPNRNHPYYKKK